MPKFVVHSQSFINYRPSHIIDRIATENGISLSEAETCFVECLKLLALNVLEPKTLHVPSKVVDKAWHSFVLHTADYRSFCLACLGGFVDHQPSPITPELIAGYCETIAQIEKHFGAADPKFWPRVATGTCQAPCDAVEKCGDCGDCHCAVFRQGRKIPPNFLQNFQRVLVAS